MTLSSKALPHAHRRRWAKSAWTDDTDMMLCILGGFENDRFNIHSVATNYGTRFIRLIHTISCEILADSEDSDEICYAVAHKQSNSP